MTASKLGSSTCMEGGSFARAARWHHTVSVSNVTVLYSRCVVLMSADCHTAILYVLLQILMDFSLSFLFWIDLHVKSEPLFHSATVGSISLMRVKVLAFSATRWYFRAVVRAAATFRSSRSHSTLSESGKKPLMMHKSLMVGAPNSSPKSGYNVMSGAMSGGTVLSAENEKKKNSLCFILMSLLSLASVEHFYICGKFVIRTFRLLPLTLNVMSLLLGRWREFYFHSVWCLNSQVEMWLACASGGIGASSGWKHWRKKIQTKTHTQAYRGKKKSTKHRSETRRGVTRDWQQVLRRRGCDKHIYIRFSHLKSF